jgi:hypothetical protein
MSNYEPIRDHYGNIDDYNAKAGEVGTRFSRRLFIHSTMPYELKKYLKELCDNGYSKTEVYLALIDQLDRSFQT